MNRRAAAVLAPLVLGLWAGALLAGPTHYRQDMHWQAPAEAAAQKNPLEHDAHAAGGGKKLFRRMCAECHGPTGRGIGHAADLQSFDVQVQSDGTLFWKITNGNLDRGMPSLANLPIRERWQLVLYLRELEEPASQKK